MANTKGRDKRNTAAAEAVRAFADAGTALARLRDDIPDREVIDDIDMAGRTRGDGLVVLRKLLGILARSGRVFAHQDDVMLTDRANSKFRLLSVDGLAEPRPGPGSRTSSPASRSRRTSPARRTAGSSSCPTRSATSCSR